MRRAAARRLLSVPGTFATVHLGSFGGPTRPQLARCYLRIGSRTTGGHTTNGRCVLLHES